MAHMYCNQTTTRFVSILFFSLVFVQSTFAQNDNDGIVYWTGKSLSWNDFAGSPEYEDIYDAHSKLLLSFTADLTDDILIVTTSAGFEPKHSWVKRNKRSEYLLDHEKLHFDICELYRRILNQHLAELQTISFSKAEKTLSRVFDEVFAQYQKEQRAYDQETDHSVIKIEQSKWNQKIQMDLRSLETYNRESVRLKVLFNTK